MVLSARRAVVPLVLLLLLHVLPAHPVLGQHERPGGIFRDLVQGLVPGTPEDLAQQARSARDAAAALRLYAALSAHHPDHPEGVRAAIWIGLYYYSAGDIETALVYFERARRPTGDPTLRAEASFWCEEARLLTGAEPLVEDTGVDGSRFWEVLRTLVGVDRFLRGGHRSDAEARLLSLEGDARRTGLLGLQVARWGDLLRLPEQGRMDREALRPLLAATAALPERLHLSPAAPGRSATPGDEIWSIQFGAFLDPDNARAQLEQLKSRKVDARIDEVDEGGRKWYRVRLGELSTEALAESLGAIAGAQSGLPFQIVRTR